MLMILKCCLMILKWCVYDFEKLFNDFNGEIKSLGAWGGDFALVIGDLNSVEYFKNKGYETIISFNSMLNNS